MTSSRLPKAMILTLDPVQDLTAARGVWMAWAILVYLRAPVESKLVGLTMEVVVAGASIFYKPIVSCAAFCPNI